MNSKDFSNPWRHLRPLPQIDGLVSWLLPQKYLHTCTHRKKQKNKWRWIHLEKKAYMFTTATPGMPNICIGGNLSLRHEIPNQFSPHTWKQVHTNSAVEFGLFGKICKIYWHRILPKERRRRKKKTLMQETEVISICNKNRSRQHFKIWSLEITSIWHFYDHLSLFPWCDFICQCK